MVYRIITSIVCLVLCFCTFACGASPDESDGSVSIVPDNPTATPTPTPPIPPPAPNAMHVFAKIEAPPHGVSSEWTYKNGDSKDNNDRVHGRFLARDNNPYEFWISDKGNNSKITLRFPGSIRLDYLSLIDIPPLKFGGDAVTLNIEAGKISNPNYQDVFFDALPTSGDEPLTIHGVKDWVVDQLTLHVQSSKDITKTPEGKVVGKRVGLAQFGVFGEALGTPIPRIRISDYAHLTSEIEVHHGSTNKSLIGQYGVHNLIDSSIELEDCFGQPNGREFVSQAGGTNTSFTMEFDSPYTIDKVVIWNRQNSSQIDSFRLIFDNGTVTDTIDLDGCRVVDLTDPKIAPTTGAMGITTKSIRLKVLSFSKSENGKPHTGLNEFSVWGFRN